MSRYDDIDPMNIDPATNRPYANYSSDALDTSLHDHEMDVDDDEDDDEGEYLSPEDRADDEADYRYEQYRDRMMEKELDGEEDDDFYSDDPRAMQGMGQ